MPGRAVALRDHPQRSEVLIKSALRWASVSASVVVRPPGAVSSVTWGAEIGIPTKRNSTTASNGARKVKMSERVLKSLRDHGPSKLKVPFESRRGRQRLQWLRRSSGLRPLACWGQTFRPFSSRREFSATVQSSFVDVLDGPSSTG